MNFRNRPVVTFSELKRAIAAEQVWEYTLVGSSQSDDVAEAARQALQQPEGFPPLADAIVSGDRVALAVDPNIPQLAEVIRGAVAAIGDTDAASIEVVLWDEASDALVERLREQSDQRTSIVRHDSVSRESLRYLSAAKSADPIYLNRHLIDADVIVPIVLARSLDRRRGNDATGIFPQLSDSATRLRHHHARNLPRGNANEDLTELGWLLGVQVVLLVTPNRDGQVGTLVAGTVEAVANRTSNIADHAAEKPAGDEFPATAPVMVAFLAGDEQQQTWINAARALDAASRCVSEDGTLVLWTEMQTSPSSTLQQLPESPQPDSEFTASEEEPFPHWDDSLAPSQVLSRLIDDHRVLIHSRIEPDVIESMGMGVIADLRELERLTRSFPACGVLQAAQFAGTALLTPSIGGQRT